MAVENPIPSIAGILLLALPGVWLLGRALARAAIRDTRVAEAAAPGIALAAWMLSLHVVGLATGSFHTALWVGTLVPAGAGVLALVPLGRATQARGPSTWRVSRWMWIGAGIAVCAIAPLALYWAFHDEVLVSGHMAIASAIENGHYPPRHPSLPAFEMRYHYGFALMVAAVSSLVRVPVDAGIDVVTLLCGGYLFVLLWTLGDRVLGNGRGWLTALITMFGAGVPFACAWVTPLPGAVLTNYCRVGGADLNPLLLSYFFQHPWTVGLPLALVTMLAALEPEPPRGRLAVIAGLLVALSIAQLVLFAALAPALVASELLSKHGSKKRAAAMLVTCAAAVLISTELGGFFAEPPPGASLELRPSAITDSLSATVIWNAATFGLLLPLGLAGLIYAGRARVLVACLGIGGFVIINTVEYANSWDIMKFGAVASLGLSIAASACVSRLIDARPRWATRPVAALAAAGLTLGAVTFVAGLIHPMPGLPLGVFHPNANPYSAEEAAVMTWLRREVRAGEIVYTNTGDPVTFAQWAGLSVPEPDQALELFGVPDALTDRRNLVADRLPDEPGAFLDERIVWFVIERDGSRADRLTDAWVRGGRAHVRFEAGGLRVVELARPAVAADS